MGILLGLSAALCWGVADFFAAFVSRRIGSVRALLLTQSFELLAVVLLLMYRGTLLVASPEVWLLALGLGVMQCVGVLLLYKAFEIGTLSIVAPLASSFVVFTALFAWLSGERPAPMALGGALLLFVGVVLVTKSASDANKAPVSGAGIWQALAAALCISVVFWQFGALVQRSATLWPVLPLRLCTVVGAALILAINRPPLPTQPPPTDADGGRVRVALWPMILAVTIANSLAWFSFNSALESAYTTVVAALSSLFSAVTVFLAWLFLQERLSRVQWAGVAVILLGVLMVSV